MTLTKKQLRADEIERARLQTGWIREPETKGWHGLQFEGSIGMTRCGLLVDGVRKPLPPAGALICALCVQRS